MFLPPLPLSAFGTGYRVRIQHRRNGAVKLRLLILKEFLVVVVETTGNPLNDVEIGEAERVV